MTIHYVLRKSNTVTNTWLQHLDLAAIIGSIKSSLLIHIHELLAAACGNSWEQFKKAGNSCENGYMFFNGVLCRIRGRIEVSDPWRCRVMNRLALVVLQ